MSPHAKVIEYFGWGEWMRSLWISLPLVAALTGFYANAASQRIGPQPPVLSECRVPGVEERALCGAIQVWEDRAARAGRRIDLRFAILPATGGAKKPDPIFVLAGGPGESAVALAALAADSFPKLRERRDIVLVDQRGTGGSNPLQCEFRTLDESVRAVFTLAIDPKVLDACLDGIRAKADVRHYATPTAMDDLDDVRAALGYEQINLYGGSYGTRAAFVYMRQHGERVRSAVLRAIAPVNMRALLPAARHAEVALAGLVRDCKRDGDCRRSFPSIRPKLDRVLQTLNARAAVIEVALPGGNKAPVTVDRDRAQFLSCSRIPQVARSSRS